MGNRTTIVCDGKECNAERSSPVVHGVPSVRSHSPGWATVAFIDDKTGFPCTWDLCPGCVKKIVELLGLPTGDQLFRADGLGLPGLSIRGLPGVLGMSTIPGLDEAPPEPPKQCEKCNTPYVGATCYFCPPTGDAA